MNHPDPDPESNLEQVLSAIGRASTPPVKESPFGITLNALTDVHLSQAEVRAIVVGAPALVRRVEGVVSAAPGVPGMLTEQVTLPLVDTLVIDWDAFLAGPWLAANTHAAFALMEEIFEAGRRMRATGRLVLGLPRQPLLASGDARLLSTCTVDVSAVPLVDLEEGAPQTPLWDVLASVCAERQKDTVLDSPEVK